MPDYPSYTWSPATQSTFQIFPALIGTDTIKGITIDNPTSGTIYYTTDGNGTPLSSPNAPNVPPGTEVIAPLTGGNSVLYFAYSGPTPLSTDVVTITITNDTPSGYSASSIGQLSNVSHTPYAQFQGFLAPSGYLFLPGVSSTVVLNQWKYLLIVISTNHPIEMTIRGQYSGSGALYFNEIYYIPSTYSATPQPLCICVPNVANQWQINLINNTSYGSTINMQVFGSNIDYPFEIFSFESANNYNPARKVLAEGYSYSIGLGPNTTSLGTGVFIGHTSFNGLTTNNTTNADSFQVILQDHNLNVKGIIPIPWASGSWSTSYRVAQSEFYMPGYIGTLQYNNNGAITPTLGFSWVAGT